MVLSDRTITSRLDSGSIKIDPLNRQDIQPASVDLHLAPSLRIFRSPKPGQYIDVKTNNDHLLYETEIPKDSPHLLLPGTFALARTTERVEIPDDIVAELEGKSSLGRLALFVHATAGYLDPGFRGTITLELTNANIFPITLYRDMEIAQVTFVQLSEPALRPYGHPDLNSKYQDQEDTTPSRADRSYSQKRSHAIAGESHDLAP